MKTREKLLEEFWRYCVKGRVIDTDFVEHFILEYSKAEGLKDYVRKVEIDYKVDSTDLANYDEVLFAITIYYMFLKENSRDRVESLLFRSKLNFDQVVAYQNILMLMIFMHEICHGDDNKTLRNGPYGIKTYLINAGFYLNEGCSQDIKDIAYEYCPLERMANVGAVERMSSFLEPVVKELPYLAYFEDFEFLKELTKGYDENERGYTVKFFKILNKYEFWKGLDFYSPNSAELIANVKELYSLDERLRLGLPIDRKECLRMTRLLNNSKIRCF